MLDRGQFQPREAHVVGIEINRHDPFGLVHQIVEDIAAAAGDRQEARFRRESEGLGIDPGVLPDLVVDKALEPHREHALEHAPLAGQAMVVDGLPQVGLGLGVCLAALDFAGLLCKTGHVSAVT